MLEELKLFRMICDKCGLQADAFVAGPSADEVSTPPHFVVKGDGKHLCEACDGIGEPDPSNHGHDH